MESVIYTIERYNKELNRRFKRKEIENYIPGNLIGHEVGVKVLARFKNLDKAKKAFAEYHSDCGCVGENLKIEEVYLTAKIIDEDEEWISGEILEVAPLSSPSVELLADLGCI